MQDSPEEWEIIVINDNPPNGDADLTLNHLAVSYIRGPLKGSAAAFQAGANAASGDKLLFINDDCIFFQPFIQPMLESFNKGYSIVGSKLLYENMTVQHAGMEFIPQFQWTANHVHRWLPHDAPEVNEWKEMPCVTFSCTLVDAKLFYDLGGFSGKFKENYSDVDLCLRALEADAKICYDPRSEIIHLESATRGHNLRQNVDDFAVFKTNWVHNGRIQKLLKEKGFVYG